MKLIVKPSIVAGDLFAPASKSYTHRAIILASFAKGESVIKNPLIANDTLYTIKACKLFGAQIIAKKNKLIIKGNQGIINLNPYIKRIYVGSSGTTLRFICAIAALANKKTLVTGTKGICRRPNQELINSLNKLGLSVKSSNSNYPPIVIDRGNFKGGVIDISGQVSSQFISALLLISPFAKPGLKIKIKDKLVSRPYVDITIDMMKKFGVKVKNTNYSSFFINSGQSYQCCNYKVEGDFTSASYFFAAAAICNSQISITGLDYQSFQGDKYFLNILKKMGCQVINSKNKISLIGNNKLKGIDIKMENFPDIVQSLAIVSSYAKGNTVIRKISHLKYKETNRLAALTKELNKMNIKTKALSNSLTIYGGNPKGTLINTYNDHRMAMSFAVMGLRAQGKTIIKNPKTVAKSYPNFFNHLKKLGADVCQVN
jgi:3-phosphoshikimate 1-carboxyvinyltransferase